MKATQNYVAVYFKENSLTAIEFTSSFRKFVFLNYGFTKLPDGVIEKGEIQNPKILMEKLDDMLKHASPKPIESKNIIVIVDDATVFHYLIEVPGNLNDKERDAVVPAEAENFVPFSRDEVSWDYRVHRDMYGGGKNNRHKDEKLELQYSAIPKNVVDKYTEVLSKNGVNVLIVTTALEAYREMTTHLPSNIKNVVVVDIGKDFTSVYAFKGRILVTSKSFEQGTAPYIQDLAVNNNLDEEDVVSLLTTKHEDKLFLGGQHKLFDDCLPKIQETIEELVDPTEIDQLYVWGNGLRIPNMFSQLQKHLNPKPQIKVLWKALPLSSKVLNDKELIRFINTNIINFGIVVGCIHHFLSPTGYKILNLVPDSRRRAVGSSLLNSFMTRIGLVIIGLSVALIFINSLSAVRFQFQQMELEQQTKNLDTLIYGQKYFQLKNDIESFNREVQTLRDISTDIQLIPGTLTTLLDFESQGIQLSGLLYDGENNMLSLNGISETRGDLVSYRDQLENLVDFGEIEAPLSNFDQSTDINFSINIILNQEMTDE